MNTQGQRKNVFYKAASLLSSREKRRGLQLTALLVLNSFFDFLSVASFIPLLLIVIEPQRMSRVSEILRLPPTTSAQTFLIGGAISIVLLVLLKNIFGIWISWLKARYAFRIAEALSAKALDAHLSMDYSRFVRLDFSRVMSNITSQPLVFSNNLILPMATAISEVIVFISIIGAIAWYDKNILGLVVIVILPMLVFYIAIRKKIRTIGETLRSVYPRAQKVAREAVEGFVEVNISGRKDFFHERFRDANASVRKALVNDHVVQTSAFRITELITALIFCTIILYTVLKVGSYQETIILLSIYAGASFRLIPSVNRILHALLQIRTHEAVLDDLVQPEKTTARASSTSSIPFRQMLELQNISFKYDDGPAVLKDFSISIRRGEKIAITGDSGEGKTTFLMLMMGFLRPQQGRILVDGEEAAPHQTLAGYVAQNPLILDCSLAQNVALGIRDEAIDRQKVADVLGEVGLGSLIEQLPKGIDSLVGEKGVALSGGQRQRLAIARALYENRSLLLTDEATNQLHASAEAGIYKIAERLSRKGTAVVMITHRLPQADFFDAVYRLERGTLTEAESNLSRVREIPQQ